MREIGVRELKQALSRTLRDVGRGEHDRVTLRGRPIADIVPAGAAASDNRLRQLITEGRLVAPARARPKRAPRLVRARRPASSLVLAERDAER
jgi:antitoxin (DNA-binding transcriptional repressor) of toxin-antitoxin stability system